MQILSAKPRVAKRPAVRALMAAAFVFPGVSTAFNKREWTKIPSQEFYLAPPPQPGSAEDRADIDQILALQETRTNAQCKLAGQMTDASFQEMFGSTRLLTLEEVTVLKPVLSKVGRMAERIAQDFKAIYRRARPYDEDSRVKVCIPKPGGGRKAYPSAHATAAAAMACVLAQVFPGRKSELAAFGDQLGELRVLVGVHHPTDVRAGGDLGRQICLRLLEDKEFRRDLSELVPD
jgi:acid phosphatase (class A)